MSGEIEPGEGHPASGDSRGVFEIGFSLYYACQGVGAVLWWLLLWQYPSVRSYFRATGAPDSTLLAFVLADLILYAGLSLVVAWGAWQRRRWLWTVLCLHSGAAVYAALYCFMLWCWQPETWLGALLMSPSLLVPPVTLWFYWNRSGAVDVR